MMFIKSAFQFFSRLGHAFPTYEEAWDETWGRYFNNVLLFDSVGDPVFSCRVADMFIVNNEQEAAFVAEYLLEHYCEEVHAYDGEVSEGSLIMVSPLGDYRVYPREKIQQKGTFAHDWVRQHAKERSLLRGFYEI